MQIEWMFLKLCGSIRDRETSLKVQQSDEIGTGDLGACGAAYAGIVSFMSRWLNNLIHRAAIPVNLMIIYLKHGDKRWLCSFGGFLWKQRSQVAHPEDGFWHETYCNEKYS